MTNKQISKQATKVFTSMLDLQHFMEMTQSDINRLKELAEDVGKHEWGHSQWRDDTSDAMWQLMESLGDLKVRIQESHELLASMAKPEDF